MRLPARVRDRLGTANRAGRLDWLQQCTATALHPGRTNPGRGILGGRGDETGGVTTTRAELNQAAKLSSRMGPPQTAAARVGFRLPWCDLETDYPGEC